jgi:hypothetical protein
MLNIKSRRGCFAKGIVESLKLCGAVSEKGVVEQCHCKVVTVVSIAVRHVKYSPACDWGNGHATMQSMRSVSCGVLA